MIRPRLLFSSYHCCIDPPSGAAQSTRDLLELLAGRGWDCRVLCGPARDAADTPLPQALAAAGLDVETRTPGDFAAFSLLHCRPGGVPVAIFFPNEPDPDGVPRRETGSHFLASSTARSKPGGRKWTHQRPPGARQATPSISPSRIASGPRRSPERHNGPSAIAIHCRSNITFGLRRGHDDFPRRHRE